MSFDLKTQIQPPVIIVGLARSGVAAYKLLRAAGFQEKEILTYDENKPEAQFRTESELESLNHVRTAVISPGVPLQKKFIQAWRKNGVFVTSEIYLALSQIQNEKIIGITGSLGKSTTTSIIGAGIRSFDPHVFVGGNLGIPFCEYALSIYKNSTTRAQWIVLELSSYQLENLGDLSLDYSLITFLSPNHLERYASLAEYYETKWTILNRTRHKMILNESGGDLKSFASSRHSEKICWSSIRSPEIKSLQLGDAQLIGKHNQDNLAMASILGQTCGFPPSYFSEMKQFGGLKHRMENLGRRRTNIFINDSKATTIDSVRAAVEATKESFPKQNIQLLLGGRDKKLPWNDLRDFAKEPRIEMLFFGEHGKIIQQTLASKGHYFSKLNLLLEFLATSGLTTQSVVLFSPGGVSQDEFSSFEERGDFFRNWVHSL